MKTEKLQGSFIKGFQADGGKTMSKVNIVDMGRGYLSYSEHPPAVPLY